MSISIHNSVVYINKGSTHFKGKIIKKSKVMFLNLLAPVCLLYTHYTVSTSSHWISLNLFSVVVILLSCITDKLRFLNFYKLTKI